MFGPDGGEAVGTSDNKINSQFLIILFKNNEAFYRHYKLKINNRKQLEILKKQTELQRSLIMRSTQRRRVRPSNPGY